MGWNSSSAASAPPPHLILGGGLFPTGILHYKQPLVSLRFRYTFCMASGTASMIAAGYYLMPFFLSMESLTSAAWMQPLGAALMIAAGYYMTALFLSSAAWMRPLGAVSRRSLLPSPLSTFV